MLNKCLEGQTAALGETHQDTLTSMNNMAESYFNKGSLKKVLELFTQCYEGQKASLGKKHDDTLETLDWIKDIKSDMKKENTTKSIATNKLKKLHK
jgi:hypothetical protein